MLGSSICKYYKHRPIGPSPSMPPLAAGQAPTLDWMLPVLRCALLARVCSGICWTVWTWYWDTGHLHRNSNGFKRADSKWFLVVSVALQRPAIIRISQVNFRISTLFIPVSVNKQLFRRRLHVGRSACHAPNQGAESRFSHRVASPGLGSKECICHRHR